ncbi:MAG: phosphoglycerate kinase [Thermoprotei archaeon]|nr:MAG: phosphoglycerate kinase [Thermoprotei archaeon]
MPKFLTIDDFDVKGKTVLLRVDFNSPIDPASGRILDNSRIVRHVETIRELAEKGAKVVILAHQGRKGDPDFTTLRQHAIELEKVMGRKVMYVDDIFGEKAKNAIKSLKEGDVLLLENVRMWDGEAVNKSPKEHAKSQLVKELAPLADLFINDAFAAAHRSHASLVGFTVVLPSAAGRVMEKELKALERVVERPKHPSIYVLGGSKVEDIVEVSENVLSKGIADLILTGGVVAMVMAAAKGLDLGPANMKFLEDKGYIGAADEVRRLLMEYGDRIRVPVDFAVKTATGDRLELPLQRFPHNAPIMDIGSETAMLYGKELLEAKTIVISGPMGVFEERRFAIGTAYVFTAAITSRAFSVIGGGHTIAAAESMNLVDKFSYASTGGGALMSLLMGEEMPAIKALEAAASRGT